MYYNFKTSVMIWGINFMLNFRSYFASRAKSAAMTYINKLLNKHQ